jgi:hypothetical protein
MCVADVLARHAIRNGKAKIEQKTEMVPQEGTNHLFLNVYICPSLCVST